MPNGFEPHDHFKRLYEICNEIDMEFDRDRSEPLYKRFQFVILEYYPSEGKLYGRWCLPNVKGISEAMSQRIKERITNDVGFVRDEI